MNKSINFLPLTISIIAIVVSFYSFFILFTANKVATGSSELVSWAEDIYPLNDQKYVLRKNLEGSFGEGEQQTIIPAGSYYVISPVGEEKSGALDLVSGRKIGSSGVELSQYENKEVYITGYHFEGKPMFLLQENNLPTIIRAIDQAVIHIDSVRTETEIENEEQIRESLTLPLDN